MKEDLKTILKSAGIKQQEIMETLDIKSLGTVSLKINGKAEFSTSEAKKLKKLINDRTGKNYKFEDLFETQNEDNLN